MTSHLPGWGGFLYTYWPISQNVNAIRQQLIEYIMRNTFENSYIKCSGETIPGPFSKKSKLTICKDQRSNIL